MQDPFIGYIFFEELMDRDGILKTSVPGDNGSRNTLIATISFGKREHSLLVWRLFSLADPRNRLICNFTLPAESIFALKQFSVEYIAVSLTNDIAIFNVTENCKVRNLKTTGMFQRAITVHPHGCNHMGSDRFAQETLIGYKYGTFSKLGLICERTSSTNSTNASNEEETKSTLTEFHMERL